MDNLHLAIPLGGFNIEGLKDISAQRRKLASVMG